MKQILKVFFALSLVSVAALADEDPFAKCPVKPVLRYAKVRGQISKQAKIRFEKIASFETLIPVYGPSEGSCVRIPDPGKLGVFRANVGGKDLEFIASARVDLKNANGERPEEKWARVTVFIRDPKETNPLKNVALLSAGAGTADLSTKSLLLTLNSDRRVEGELLGLFVIVEDSEVAK